MSFRVLQEHGIVRATPDNPWPDAVIECKEPSLARQSEADACDINKIMARYERTGVLPVEQREALFLDVSEVGDYRTLLEQVRGTERVFAQLPAGVRARFGNDPAALMDFMADPANLAEARALGLVEAADEPPAKVEPRPEAGGGGAASGGS